MANPHERRVLAARERDVEASGRTFTIRRVSDLALSRMRREHPDGGHELVEALVRVSVVGWSMTEAGLYAGGSDSAVPFDATLFWTWVEDQPQTFTELAAAVTEQLNDHLAQRDASEKN